MRNNCFGSSCHAGRAGSASPTDDVLGTFGAHRGGPALRHGSAETRAGVAFAEPAPVWS